MSSLEDIDRRIRQLLRQDAPSIPFLCQGSPIGCDVAVVGINPGSDTPFWPYWNVETGCNKSGWLADYRRRKGRLYPTRDRIETLCKVLAPLKCLELNLYPYYSPNEASLGKEHQNTALLDFMLKTVRPRVLFVHGNTPIKHLSSLLGFVKPLDKGQFSTASYLGSPIDVFAAESHFSRVSRDYVSAVGGLIHAHVLGKKDAVVFR